MGKKFVGSDQRRRKKATRGAAPNWKRAIGRRGLPSPQSVITCVYSRGQDPRLYSCRLDTTLTHRHPTPYRLLGRSENCLKSGIGTLARHDFGLGKQTLRSPRPNNGQRCGVFFLPLRAVNLAGSSSLRVRARWRDFGFAQPQPESEFALLCETVRLGSVIPDLNRKDSIRCSPGSRRRLAREHTCRYHTSPPNSPPSPRPTPSSPLFISSSSQDPNQPIHGSRLSIRSLTPDSISPLVAFFSHPI